MAGTKQKARNIVSKKAMSCTTNFARTRPAIGRTKKNRSFRKADESIFRERSLLVQTAFFQSAEQF